MYYVIDSTMAIMTPIALLTTESMDGQGVQIRPTVLVCVATTQGGTCYYQ